MSCSGARGAALGGGGSGAGQAPPQEGAGERGEEQHPPGP